jgi:hypothetical protein
MANFLLGLLGNLLAAEIGAWCRGTARKIVCATARKLPEKLQARMLEEWSALLEDIPDDLSKLWMAISLYRKRSVLVDECEQLIDEPLPSLIGMDALTEIEHAVFSLLVEGKSIQEISYMLDVHKFTVEYRIITGVQKLTGQSNIKRTDLLQFIGAIKNHRNKVIGIFWRFRREMRWRKMRIEQVKRERGAISPPIFLFLIWVFVTICLAITIIQDPGFTKLFSAVL